MPFIGTDRRQIDRVRIPEKIIHQNPGGESVSGKTDQRIFLKTGRFHGISRDHDMFRFGEQTDPSPGKRISGNHHIAGGLDKQQSIRIDLIDELIPGNEHFSISETGVVPGGMETKERPLKLLLPTFSTRI